VGATLGTLVTVLFGAVIGFIPNYLLERRRESALLRTRWDSALFQLCSEFTASARGLDELAEQYARRREAGTDDLDIAERIAAEHQRLRSLGEQIRLLGSQEVQLAARWVVRHAYAVREEAEGRSDPRADEFPARMPRDRFRDALDALYLAARAQLRVTDAELVASREPILRTAPVKHRP